MKYKFTGQQDLRVEDLRSFRKRSTLGYSQYPVKLLEGDVAVSTSRIILAAVLGGVAMFVWGALDHEVLPLYNNALQKFTNEEAVTQAIVSGTPVSGTYFMPYIVNSPPGASEAEKKAAEQANEQRSQKGPQMFAFVRVGDFGSFGIHLLGELLKDIVATFIFVWLLMGAGVSSMRNRILFGIALGLVVVFSETMSHWIWYDAGFLYTLSVAIDQVGSFVVASVVISTILPGGAIMEKA